MNDLKTLKADFDRILHRPKGSDPWQAAQDYEVLCEKLIELAQTAVDHAVNQDVRVTELKNDLQRTINIANAYYSDLFASNSLVSDLRWALDELTATVRGEAPRLLDEDCGGNGRFAVMLDEIISRKPNSGAHGRACEALKFYAEQWSPDMMGTGEQGSTQCFKAPTPELLADEGSKAQQVLQLISNPIPKRSNT